MRRKRPSGPALDIREARFGREHPQVAWVWRSPRTAASSPPRRALRRWPGARAEAQVVELAVRRLDTFTLSDLVGTATHFDAAPLVTTTQSPFTHAACLFKQGATKHWTIVPLHFGGLTPTGNARQLQPSQ